MFSKIKKQILKRIYRVLICRVVLLNKHKVNIIDDFTRISDIVIATNQGDFVFEFSIDKDASYRSFKERFFTINMYLLSLRVPELLIKKNEVLSNHVLLAIKFILIRPNLAILAELLIDLYMDKALKVSTTA